MFAAVALTWVLATVIAQCGVSQFQHHAAHPNHPLVTLLGGEFVINIDHAHLSDRSTPPCWGSRTSWPRLATSSCRAGAVRQLHLFRFAPVKIC